MVLETCKPGGWTLKTFEKRTERLLDCLTCKPSSPIMWNFVVTPAICIGCGIGVASPSASPRPRRLQFGLTMLPQIRLWYPLNALFKQKSGVHETSFNVLNADVMWTKRWVVVHTTEMMFRIVHLQVFPQPQHIPLCLMMGPSQNNVPEWAGNFFFNNNLMKKKRRLSFVKRSWCKREIRWMVRLVETICFCWTTSKISDSFLSRLVN